MATYHLSLPLTKAEVRALRVGDIVYLSGEITATGGLPGHKRIRQLLQAGEALPVKSTGAFFHLPTMLEDGPQGPRVLYVNPTTSMRFDDFMPLFIRSLGLDITAGKGGLGEASLAAMQETGCVYLSLLGGGSPILTAGITEVVEVAWEDLPSHFRLMTLRVEALGPLTVGMDANGGSTYEVLARSAADRLPEILAELSNARREFDMQNGGDSGERR